MFLFLLLQWGISSSSLLLFSVFLFLQSHNFPVFLIFVHFPYTFFLIIRWSSTVLPPLLPSCPVFFFSIFSFWVSRRTSLEMLRRKNFLLPFYILLAALRIKLTWDWWTEENQTKFNKVYTWKKPKRPEQLTKIAETLTLNTTFS